MYSVTHTVHNNGFGHNKSCSINFRHSSNSNDVLMQETRRQNVILKPFSLFWNFSLDSVDISLLWLIIYIFKTLLKPFAPHWIIYCITIYWQHSISINVVKNKYGMFGFWKHQISHIDFGYYYYVLNFYFYSKKNKIEWRCFGLKNSKINEKKSNARAYLNTISYLKTKSEFDSH